MKKVFRETQPMLPGPFERIDIASMPDALRWAAIGVNPEKLEFQVVVEAESENDAQLLYRAGSDLYARASDELISSFRKLKEGSYPELINEENLKQLGQFLIPKPEGNRFVVKSNGDALQTVVDKSPSLLAAFRKIITSERSRQRSSPPQDRKRHGPPT
jgi:hypothetical protein